jgi:hypothetical protein
MQSSDLRFWQDHSPITEPGAAASLLDALPSDPAALTAISAQLVFHYRADGDWEANGISLDRAAEINLCYAADMFERLRSLDSDLAAKRPPATRILGCCRDFTNLYVAILRHKHVPARTRVGFADYFSDGWLMDHVVAEVWDDASSRWRLIDPELLPGFEPAGGALDRLDLSPDRFLTAPQLWLRARAGEIDPERAVVHPDLHVPETRGWEQIRHNLIHDLASLNKTSLLLWDDWGLDLDGQPLEPGNAALLDQLARDTADTDCPLRTIRAWGRREGLAVPEVVHRVDPVTGTFTEVDVRRALTI